MSFDQAVGVAVVMSRASGHHCPALRDLRNVLAGFFAALG